MRVELERRFPSVSIVDAEAAVDRFNAFLSGRYAWAVSGISWPSEGHLERVHTHIDLTKTISEMMRRHPVFSDKVSVFFADATDDIVATGARDDVLALMQFVETWDDVLVTEFWVFDQRSGACVEAYHEGYITLSLPFLPKEPTSA
ncbi:MAG: hypothetical protein A4S17_02910 [Proteobacteria bacterium HN_bin10]|nr:MAG: hypothetical protein A4S17_02910 [Proteobacteria bacterium HN_bin10]